LVKENREMLTVLLYSRFMCVSIFHRTILLIAMLITLF